MRFHERVHHFGRLEVVEVYEFYDKPVLVSYRSAIGVLYLAVLVEDSSVAESWLYVAMTNERFVNVRSGLIDLYSAFMTAEDGVAFRVSIPYSESEEPVVDPVETARLSQDVLPVPGERITVLTETLPHFAEILSTEAARSRRDMLKLTFELPAMFRTEAPAKFVGMVLSSLQDTVSAIAQAIETDGGGKREGRRGKLTKQIMASSELAVLGVGAGSFEIKLASTASAGLFDTTSVTDAMREFVHLLQIGSQAELLQERLAKLRARVASNYLTFLQALDNRIDTTQAEWATPSSDTIITARLSAVTVRAAIAILKYETFESSEEQVVIGRLTGASVTKKTFELSTGPKKSDQIHGQVADEALATVNGAIINEVYRAHLVRSQAVKPATREVVEQVTLLSLTPSRPAGN